MKLGGGGEGQGLGFTLFVCQSTDIIQVPEAFAAKFGIMVYLWLAVWRLQQYKVNVII